MAAEDQGRKGHYRHPFYSKAHQGIEASPVKIQAQMNIRESAIVTLAARKRINDAACRANGIEKL
ncbi:hypothetical protein ACCS54_35875 [Rhizobium johnstonii]|uniref:hypothetical protein n=1 Tax=Rhizobium johnstonii TaxID=3019933 RepID=UPI003F9D56EE